VLLDSYVEYFSPLWIWPHWLLARWRHTRYAANLHDPVRDHRVGPAWWHGLSVRLAYLPLEFVLVHHPLPEPSPVPKRVKVCEVPVGVYEVAPGTLNPRSLRNEWLVPAGARVFLAFGYIRDNKNLDLVLKAMTDVPDVFLVVAGRESSSHSRPLKFYRDLAAGLGIADRVRFFDQFIADNEVAAYYGAADFIVLTYAASFVSQSAVLNVAARLAKPVLASSGPGPLRNSVERFGLGVFVEPDSVPAIAGGMRRLLAGDIPAPAWENYLAYASWRTNAAAILAELGEPGAATLSPLPGVAV
jgi:glycosyltransferase involved in cell wall biosynthesis